MDQKTIKKQVRYNEDAILCPACKKRIRLNNDGRVRVHIAGKAGSGKCMGSNAKPLDVLVEAENKAYPLITIDPQFLQKDEPEQLQLFSDIV